MDIKEWIKKWVAENYGQSEADDPSWDIGELAKQVLLWHDEIERQQQRWNCEEVANDMGKELTDEQIDAITDEFMKSEAYVDIHREDWEHFINEELGD